MKKQNVNKLAFQKSSLVELNDNQLNAVSGGTLFTLITLATTVLAPATITLAGKH
ncbi:class I lanthipeptide [Flavobacterium cerinum]|uniref:Class I lanthipeptide n=1 Tax=Flavobacterium cerinum TaxID=2502784 RepID=A0ABY5ITQ6_9FLAO|nr:class I lanthipeptide [Flavobacterium cerinum]UUC46179.1 class I lanthipeptide [Flavobacterium cerinum]